MLSQGFAPLTGVELKIFIRRLSVDSSEVGLSSACGDGSEHSDWLRTKSRDRGDVMAAISQPRRSSSSGSGGGDGVAERCGGGPGRSHQSIIAVSVRNDDGHLHAARPR